MIGTVQNGVIADNLAFIIPPEAHIIALPVQSADPFRDPDGFIADQARTAAFWKALMDTKPTVVQYSSGALTSVLSQYDGAYRLSVFDKRGPLSHREIGALDDLMREVVHWHGTIAVM